MFSERLSIFAVDETVRVRLSMKMCFALKLQKMRQPDYNSSVLSQQLGINYSPYSAVGHVGYSTRYRRLCFARI